MQVYFSPPPGIPAVIQQLIDGARETIDLAMYHFTESTLARTLGAAVLRGVRVRAVLDHGSIYETNSMAWTLARKGVEAFSDHAHSILHTKYCIIDAKLLVTGSANWTYNSDGAAGEDLLVLEPPPEIIVAYQDNWAFHRAHSIPLPRMTHAWPTPTIQPREPR
jgi:phosphatidylserine/phosphatidylglycerophosphate/cardiolipin synthase-like enzyme